MAIEREKKREKNKKIFVCRNRNNVTEQWTCTDLLYLDL